MFKYLLFLVLMTFATQADAQAYTTAIGVRIGSDYGATIQQRLTKKITLEGIYYGGFSEENVHANLLAQRHFPILGRRTNIYVGAGIGSHWIYNETNETFGAQQFVVPAVVGFEVSVGRINIAGDIMPHFSLMDKKLNSFNNVAALSVRYILVKKKPVKNLVDKIEDKFPGIDKKKKKKSKSNKKNGKNK